MAGMQEVLTLVEESIAKDANQTVSKAPTTVFADKKPLYAGEFHSARAEGKDLQHIMVVHSFEYSGQTKAIYQGKEYTIYRTYQRNSDWCELYLSSKGANSV